LISNIQTSARELRRRLFPCDSRQRTQQRPLVRSLLVGCL
jgi:hypothetical protein